MVINPHDGAMYFAIGGRRTKSGLYRVTYTGAGIDALRSRWHALSRRDTRGFSDHALRIQGVPPKNLQSAIPYKSLEAFHGHRDSAAVATAWPYLNHPDRFIRYAARVAIEHARPRRVA